MFWTANWLLWLLAWFALINQSLETSVVLNDLGAFCLIAFSIAFSEGTATVKKYVVPLCAFFTLDVIYMLSVNVLVHSHTPGETSIVIPPGVQANEWVNKWVSDVVDRHTVLFGPSLCLTMLAIGVAAGALARRPKRFELSIVVGFVGVLYALSRSMSIRTDYSCPSCGWARAPSSF